MQELASEILRQALVPRKLDVVIMLRKVVSYDGTYGCKYRAVMEPPLDSYRIESVPMKFDRELDEDGQMYGWVYAGEWSFVVMVHSVKSAIAFMGIRPILFVGNHCMEQVVDIETAVGGFR